MAGPERPQVAIRPFTERRDYERMIDYFVGADDASLMAMGVDRKKLPTREAWLESVLLDHARDNSAKDRYYLAWDYKDDTIGHSSINKISMGEEAYIHLHLWKGALRRAGLGNQYFKASVAEFVRQFKLKRIFCEPYASNPGPNRVLVNAGFRLIKRYRTIPGPFTFEQDVNQYVLEGLSASPD